MNVHDGRLLSEADYNRLAEIEKENWVLVQGLEKNIKAMSHRVKLGAAEEARRKARREQQRASRKANR